LDFQSIFRRQDNRAALAVITLTFAARSVAPSNIARAADISRDDFSRIFFLGWRVHVFSQK
jgi:hypothetical protein